MYIRLTAQKSFDLIKHEQTAMTGSSIFDPLIIHDTFNQTNTKFVSQVEQIRVIQMKTRQET